MSRRKITLARELLEDLAAHGDRPAISRLLNTIALSGVCLLVPSAAMIVTAFVWHGELSASSPMLLALAAVTVAFVLWGASRGGLEELGETARVPGVEVARGEKILGSLRAEGLIGPRQVRPAPMIALADLAKVHSQT